MARPIPVLISMLVLLAGCTSAAGPTPIPSAPDPSAPVIASPTPTALTTPTGHATATPAGPTPVPSSAAAGLPVRGSAQSEGRLADVRMVPSVDGSLYVLVAAGGPPVLALLDRAGRPMPGWPVEIPFATQCSFVGAADDGSVRAVCDATDIRQPDWCCDTVRAVAFDRVARPLAGWPVEIDTVAAARVVGDDLVVLSDLPVTDVEAWGAEGKRAHLARVLPDGSVVQGTEVPILFRGGGEAWAIGPDGVAYATSYIAASEHETEPPWMRSEVLAVGIKGAVAGWPVAVEGVASTPAFDVDGRIVVSAGSWNEPRSRVIAIEPAGKGTAVTSAMLPLELAASGLQCGRGLDVAPLSAEGMVVTSDVGISPGGRPTWYALDATLHPLPGWPYRASPRIQEAGYPEPDSVDCGAVGVPVDPALSRDGILHVALAAATEATGGSLVAIDRGGRVVEGWPVELRRAGSGFWSVIAGPDRTVFALAVEREVRGASATIVAIAPDSTVLWRTTVLEP